MIPKDRTEEGFVNESNDPYNFHKGKYVEVEVNRCSYIGVYRGLTKLRKIVLKPYVKW